MSRYWPLRSASWMYPLVAKLKLRDRPPPPVVVGDEIILPQLGGGGQVQALAQQGRREHRPGVARLERRIDRHGGADGRHEAACPLRVPQGVVNELFVFVALDGDGELGPVALGLQTVVRSHNQILLYEMFRSFSHADSSMAWLRVSWHSKRSR